MTRTLSLGTCIGLLTFAAEGGGVSNVSFGNPRPLRYVRPQNDYRFVHVRDEHRNVFAEVVPGCRVRLWACPVGECVLGRNTIRPRMQFLGRDGQTATRVRVVVSLKEQGRPLRPCVDETVTVTNVKDGSEFPFTYTIERMGQEQSVVAAFYESDPDAPDIRIEVPCPIPYLGRVVLTRPTFWESDPSARAWVCLNLDRDHLNRFKLRVHVTSEQGRECWGDTVDELRGRLLWFDADLSSLPNGKYTLECEVVDENGAVRDRQSNDFVKKPLPVVERRTLPITVEDAPGITRDRFPACADVPFPDGELASSHGLRLLDAAGQEVDAQFTPTGFWNERRTFVKWLRIALNAATGATGESKYTLEYGSDVKRNPVTGIGLREGPTIAVKTGKLEFEAGKAAPAGRVRVGGAQIDLVGHIELARPVRPKSGPFSEVDGHLLRNLSQDSWRFKTEMGDQDRTADWSRPDFDDRKWKPIRTTTFWDEQGHMHTGYAWYRLTFPLSAEQVRQDAFLHFGAVDERASVYLNGEYLGGTEDKGTTWWQKPFTVPTKGKLSVGRNVLAVRVHNSTHAGGIWKPVGLFAPPGADTDRTAASAKVQVTGRLRFDTEDPALAETVVDERGPVRTVVRTSGWYTGADGQRAGRYQLRFYLFRGLPFAKIEHTFIFTEDANQFLVREIALSLKCPGQGQYRFGLESGSDGATAFASAAADLAELRQTSSKAFAGPDQVRGKRAAGWAELRSEEARVIVFLDDFWQNFPSALRVDGNELVVVLYGGEGSPPLDLRNDREGGCAFGGLGVAKTQTLWVWFGERDMDAGEITRRIAQFANPLRPVAPPKWMCFSGVTGAPIWPHDPDLFPNEEKQLAQVQRGLAHQRDWSDIFGFTDYGDLHHRWNRQRNEWDRNYRYWLNDESTLESTTSINWLQYLRTGKRADFEFCAQRSWHLMDIDTIHQEEPGPLSGDVTDRNTGTGFYSYKLGVCRPHAINHWYFGGKPDHTHAWHSLWHAHFSGGYRGFDLVEELASTIRRHGLAEIGCQWRGFHFIARYAVDVYQHLWDEELIEFARQNLDVPIMHYPRQVTVGGDCRPILSYDRYLRQTGDGWLRKRCIDEHWGTHNARVDHSRAILYSHLRDPALMNFEMFKRLNYPGISSKFPAGQDYQAAVPPGYGWAYLGIPKYAWTMWALVDSEKWPPPPEPVTLRSNGRGGGAWSDPKTWEAGREPNAGEGVAVVKGDQVVVDGAGPVRCARLTVEGKLSYAPGERTLVVAGDAIVRKGGELRLGPGSSLKIACSFLVQHGLLVEDGGSLLCRGTSPAEPDALLASLSEDRELSAYAYCGPGAKVSIRNITIRNLGHSAPPRKGQEAHPRPYKYFDRRSGLVLYYAPSAFTGNRVIGCGFGLDVLLATRELAVRNCEFRGCDVGLQIRYGKQARFHIENCRFIENQTGAQLSLRHDPSSPGSGVVSNSTFSGNTQIGLSLLDACACELTLKGNRYEGNGIGLETLSSTRGAQALADEVFVGNRTGLAVRACDLRLERCRFGRSGDSASPNSEADILFTTWSRRGTPSQSGSVTLHDCVLAGPTPVAPIDANAEAWVLSTNHNREPGVRRTWGPVPAGITD